MKCWTSDSLLGLALESYRQTSVLKVDTEHGHLRVRLYEIRHHLGGQIEIDPDRDAHLPRQHRLLGVAEPSWDTSQTRIGVEIICLGDALDGILTTNQRSWVPSIKL